MSSLTGQSHSKCTIVSCYMLHVARLTCLLHRFILSFLCSSSSKSHRRFFRKSTCQLPIFTFVMFYSPKKFPKAWAGRWTLRMMQSYKKSRNNYPRMIHFIFLFLPLATRLDLQVVRKELWRNLIFPSDVFILNWNKRVNSKSVDSPNILRGLDLEGEESIKKMRWAE